MSATACLFQVEIRKAYEVRAMVVGTRIIAARILSQESPLSKVDFRRDYDHLSYERETLPAEIHALLLQLVALAGLEFAAIDLVVDRQGSYWFLDLNPAGQWAWLDAYLELGIATAIADLLTGKAPSLGSSTYLNESTQP